MLDGYMRGVFARAVRPIVILLHEVHPLWLSMIGLLFGLGAAVAAGYQLYGLAFALWIINRIFDGLDGGVARYSNRQSDMGGYIDILLDFVIYAAVPIGVVVGQPSSLGYFMLALLLASFYVNSASWMYLSALLEKRALGADAQGERTSVTMPAGLIDGSATIVFFSVFILFPQWYIWVYGLMTFLVMVTVIQRLPWAAKHLD